MKVEEKKQLREELLKELYDWHHERAGREVIITFNDLHNNEDDKKKHLAYLYLSEKGLIEYKVFSKDRYSARISVYGIDYIEETE